MTAYHTALRSQVDCIEIDVSRSSDGVLFALHDSVEDTAESHSHGHRSSALWTKLVWTIQEAGQRKPPRDLRACEQEVKYGIFPSKAPHSIHTVVGYASVGGTMFHPDPWRHCFSFVTPQIEGPPDESSLIGASLEVPNPLPEQSTEIATLLASLQQNHQIIMEQTLAAISHSWPSAVPGLNLNPSNLSSGNQSRPLSLKPGTMEN
ncbi:PLC-like phosphodiesterases superfamily protein [Actinidia rufa]|uniref:glycerophosphodiester phosphodiesterase n=1 Tax=Actinidia rufa TaxID=165716 RepID=A0A7J0GG03_9ERIC|nr:PLC-like phosphodiesterases superfamily protein [Actinidia rufa]